MSRNASRIIAALALFFFVMPNTNSYGKNIYTNEEPASLKHQNFNDDSPKPFPESEINQELLHHQTQIKPDFPGFSTADGKIVSIPQHHPTLHNQPAILPSNQENRITSSPGNIQQSPAASGIYGHVTLNGTNISGVSLQLRYYNGSTWSTLATTSTDTNGNFSFTGAASLAAGERYYVLYKNTAYTSGRIWVWSTAYLTSYTSGDDVHIGDFDIADVEDFSPDYGKTISLPAGFSWDKRPATPSDDYELELFNPSSDDFWFMTLGYNSSHTLNCLPAGFSPNTEYGWQVGINSPDGGYGYTFYYQIKFKNNPNCFGIRGTVTQNGAAASGIYLQLRYFNNDDDSYSTRSEFTTGLDGVYKFVNVPTINDGDRYYIRFLGQYNDGDSNHMLSFWGTQQIENYTQNSDSAIGDFDIDDIDLGFPTDGSSITLPYTFTWSLRDSSPGDNYHLAIEDSATSNPWWLVKQGYHNSFSLNCLYFGMQTNYLYKWWIDINSPGTNAYGVSYYYKQFQITNGLACEDSFLPLIMK